MAAKGKGRVAPRLHANELSDTLLEQLAEGEACDASASGVVLPPLVSARGQGTRLVGCLLEEVTLSDPKAHGLHVQDCRIERSDLAHMDLTGGLLERVEIVGTRLTGAIGTEMRMKSVLFRECKLDFSLWRMARLEHCVFERCNLTDADLYGADLTGTVFRACDLRRADLGAAKLAGADLRESMLDEMKGTPASLEGLTISPEQAAVLISLFGVRVAW